MLDAATQALGIITEPYRLMFVAFGTFLGLLIGVIPGIGGLVGLSLLLPLTFSMDPYTALAFLVGVQSVTTTSDTIPAVLFGVPGTVGSAATVLDGHPMAKNGQAGRAYGAAFTASVAGGLFGAFVLALTIPLLRPFMLSIGTPDLLAVCLLGLTLVVALSHGALFKGIVAAALGLLLATIGDEPQTGELRWTFDMIYLWDGLPLVPLALGLFAIPEIIDLATSKKAIAEGAGKPKAWQQLEGVRDVLKNWWLVLRCSSIGTVLGAIPGMGASVIDWVAYGYAARTEKGAAESFGKGDVRGVIASESSNNAKEGGALVPTLAFGVPGSASMALLLGAFLIHGITPGPGMLDKHLDMTFTLIWTVALANILGAGACFMFADKFAKIAGVRPGMLVPLVFGIMVVSAYQGSKDYGDLLLLLAIGTLGWVMKRLGWPRPPLILGFVLGGLVENYLFISHLRYGVDWMLQPIPMVLFAVMALMLFKPLVGRFMKTPAKGSDSKTSGMSVAGKASFGPHARGGMLVADLTLWVLVIAMMIYVIVSSSPWELSAKLLPQAVAVAGLIAAGFFGIFAVMGRIPPLKEMSDALPLSGTLVQAAWAVGLILAVPLIGMLPAMVLYVFAYMVLQGETRPLKALVITVLFSFATYGLFHLMLHVPWPQSYLGDLLPGLRSFSGRLI
ncbi:hypothetical protein GH722_17360 [Alphaproteobacteria bacterium HT1-32]|nr:hypothetical protein [Alphaproteobacteria bacterium HT1-32]